MTRKTTHRKESIMHQNDKLFAQSSMKPLQLLSVWFVFNLFYRPTSILYACTFTSAEHTKSYSVSRRCVGHFFATFERNFNNDSEGNNEPPFGGDRKKRGNNLVPSMLNWLHESTSCDVPSKPLDETLSSFPSWKRKKKTADSHDVLGSATTVPTDEEKYPPYNVIILLMKNQPITEEIVTLSSGLLVAGFDVTIFFISQDDDANEMNDKQQTMTDYIRFEVFSRIPPHDDLLQRAEDSFALVELEMEKDGDTKICPAPHPLHRCAIHIAPSVLKLLMREVDGYIASKARDNGGGKGLNASYTKEDKGVDCVLMMDASFLGGLLYSEIKMLPTIAIGSRETLELAIEYDPRWSPSQKRSTIDRMDKLFLQRIGSLGLTGAFLQANRMRRSLGLQELNRLKSPLDFFQPQSMVAMLANLIPIDTSLSLSSSVALFPELQSNYYDADDEELNAKWTRSLIRALSLTKQSLEGYDECLFDRNTCQNEVAGFEVNWLSMQEKDEEQANVNFPPVVPSFIHQETSINILDSVIRKPNTAIALMDCTPEASILAGLGIEIICISDSVRVPTFDSVYDLLDEKQVVSHTHDSNDANNRDAPSRLLLESMSNDTINPEEVATQLLRVLRRKSIGVDISDDGEKIDLEKQTKKKVASYVRSGLERTITIVETTARVHRENSWENLRQMQQVTSKAIAESLRSKDQIQQDGKSNHFSNTQSRDIVGKKELHDTFTIFIAWVMFLSAALYLLCKDTTVVKRWRQQRHHHNKHALIDGILTRLRDVDDAWDMLVTWSAQFAVIISSSVSHDGLSAEENEDGKNAVGITGHDQQLSHSNQIIHSHSHHHGHMRRRRKSKTAR
eukprot:jgi/Psemu1/291730/fgenesh1_pg.793_\